MEHRLWTRLMELGCIGRDPAGGVTRLSYSKEERQAKDLVARYMREAGLAVREDAVGNLIGRREGKQADGPVILIGSHIDSVISGGDFDGPLGVLSGVEVLQRMNEEGIVTQRPIEVTAFTDEEGARFRYGMIGSRATAGTLSGGELTATDPQGVSIEEAMRRAGCYPEDIASAVRPAGSVHAYVELHIEQGKVLEQAGLPVGVVSGIAGPLWLRFTVTGEAGHAGTTPMSLRHDALVGAARMIQMIEDVASHYERTVATVGQLTVKPGGVNIIPGEVEFTLDLRDVDESIRNEAEQEIVRQAQLICQHNGLALRIDELQRVAPAPCSEMIQEASLGACERLGIGTMQLPSGAGHDGMQLVDLCPVGMIFVRSKNGISHNPSEWTSPEDCITGADVLYHTVLQLAGGDVPQGTEV